MHKPLRKFLFITVILIFSTVLTFIPVFAANGSTVEGIAPAGTELLSLDATVAISSCSANKAGSENSYEMIAERWSKSLLVDGSLSTGGYSTDPYDKESDPNKPVTITVTLPSVAQVSAVAIFPSGACFPEDYTISVSKDGSTYKEVAKASGVTGQTAPAIYEIEKTDAKYVRLNVTKRGGEAGRDGVLVQLSEFAVYGSFNAGEGSITMDKPAVELVVGEKFKITATKKATESTIVWSTSDKSIVEVDAEGNLTGIAVGKATVTASVNSLSCDCTVYVVEKEYSFDDDIMISIFWPPTQDYINDEQYKYMADAGITWVMGSGDNLGNKDVQMRMLELCYKYGIHMTVGDGRLGGNLLSMNEKQITNVINQYKNVPGANGYYMLDEPMNANGFIDAYTTLKKLDPKSYMHLNFLPYGCYSSVDVYKSQMNDWLKLCAQTGYPQDYLMYDLYPFGLQKGSMNRTGFLLNLNAVREVGLENGVKTGTYIQSVTQSVAFRSPTESETRYEINMALAFGVKQLSYFTWFTPFNRNEPFEDGIISYKGVPNPKYSFICRLNKMVHTVGTTLINCDSLEVYESSNTYNAIKRIPTNFFVQRTDKSDFTVTYLRDRNNGRNYCMVVNNDFTNKKTFGLKFDSAIKSLQYLSEEDGKIYDIAMDADNCLTIELEAGAARIFVLPEGYDRSKSDNAEPAEGENLALNAQVYCDTSVGSSGWYMNNLNDGKKFSNGEANGWQSTGKNTACVKLDLGRELTFNRVDLYPSGDMFGLGTNMPKGFTVSYSSDGESWTKAAVAENFAMQGDNVPSLKFNKVKARYIKIDITEFNGGTVSISEIEVYNDNGTVPAPESLNAKTTVVRGKTVVDYKEGANIALNKSVKVSSYPEATSYKSWGWWPDFVCDGTTDKGWTSNVKLHMNSEDATEYCIIDLADNFSIDTVKVIPLGCWPKDFEIRVSTDGINWTTIASETNSKLKPYVTQPADKPVGRYVMFIATKLSGTATDGFMLQLGDIEVYGTPYKNEAEARELMKQYTDNGGSADSASYKAVTEALADKNATQSKLDKLMRTMLGEVSLTLTYKQPEAVKANYVFNYGPFDGNHSGDTTTAAPGTEPSSTDSPSTEPSDPATTAPVSNEGKTNNKALIIAGIAACAVIIAGAVIYAVISTKKKK